ncbi:glycosyl hydrolase family 3 [Lachnoclostridium sp. An169]|uniref:beta-glucosidase n=1 Tax=Lachnoclostridium sp. An169 TaxID=1965569 RepID=UPI000B388855|nr:glycoside hydrolase family 3 C-terminal domain-containing protein [Lachnoclostridium sp. An169]OUP83795.1 glycosyl hydrolase family 3 [Lachnoclostridium sp. An169]HJA66447.1 glycoside hydrolase family 3 C-terminal domain-containing protein [Candidatus Mediterraneibacter cottocaccae]
MEKRKKLRMNNTKFRIILIPILAVFVVFAIVLTTVTNYFTSSLDTFLGKGERTATTPSGTDGWDTNYYDFKTGSQEEAREASAAVAEQIADEGEVLLKNDGLLPLSKETEITPLGYRYINPIMSGSGSGSTNTSADYVYTPQRGLKEAFDNVNDAAAEAMAESQPTEITPVATSGEGGQTAFLGASVNISEYPLEVYQSISDTCKDTIGIIFIGRASGEGGDLYTQEYTDGTPHQLALTSAERDMIKFAEENCKGVVVVLNSCNTMQIPELEDDDEINAIIQMCTPGAMGFKSLGKILNGTVTPSGRTVDTFAADHTMTPTFVNFNNGTGNTVYENTSYTRDIWLAAFKGGSEFKAPFREYEEDVYLGYRWYETAADLGYFTSDNLPEGVTDPYYNRDNGVVYPFGYGLSYTTFDQEITEFTDQGNTIDISVKVTNTGDTYAGKEVVQLYYEAPYTQFDIDNSIEKSTVNLIDYQKTDILQPGESQTLSFTLEKEDMASYCYTHHNENGTTGCYVLENGEYTVSVRANSHEIYDTRTFSVEDTFWYDGSDEDHIRQSEKEGQSQWDAEGNPTGTPENPDSGFVAATNQFEHANQYMTDEEVGHDVTILTRSDWADTQPSAPTEETRQASDTVKEWLDYGYATYDLGNGIWDADTDPVLGNVEGSEVYVPESEMPESDQDNGLTLSDMRGLDYYDPLWDELLDQIDYASDEINSALFVNGYASGKLSSVGKMATSEHDGPQGIGLNDNEGNSWVDCCSFPAATTMAQTYNVELAYEMGKAVAEENYWIDGGGWYAPAVNLHWSPFSGRNYEYYSEDPIVSGKMAAKVISGAGDNGTYCALKHFAMVDQEEQRWWIPSVWATEQTIRELYLKPFEMAVKESVKTIKYISDDQGTVSTKTMRACDCMMSSGWSGIGGIWTAYDYNLLTNVLRNEWGFQGFVITDYDQGNGPNDDIAVNRMVRAGTDQHMIDNTMSPGKYTETDNATGVTALRKAVKNTLFTMANSAQVNGAAPGAEVYYSMSPWRIAVIAVDIVIGLGTLWGIAVMIIRSKDAKKNPERYKKSKKKNESV